MCKLGFFVPHFPHSMEQEKKNLHYDFSLFFVCKKMSTSVSQRC